MTYCSVGSQNADQVLSDMASLSGGFGFYFSGGQTSTAIQDALLATVERRKSRDSPIGVSSCLPLLVEIC